MSLRTRLFLLFGGLVASLIAAEAWLVSTLARDLTKEVELLAVSVGRAVVQVCASNFDNPEASFAGGHPPSPPLSASGEALVRENRFVFVSKDAKELPLPTQPPGSGVVFDQRIVTEDIRGSEGGGDRVVTTIELSQPGSGRPIIARKVFGFSGSTVDGDSTAACLVLRGPHAETAIPIPSAGVADAMNRYTQRVFFGSLAIFAAGLLVAGVVAHRVSAPLRELAQAARTVGEGELGTQVTVRSGGEVGEAVSAFNRMSERLAKLNADAEALRGREHLSELGEIGRGLAHTLRNPLNALGLSVEELAARNPEDAASAELAEGARRQIRRVDGSIRSFLALANGGGGAEESLSIADLARDVVLDVLQDARGRARIDVAEENAPRILAVPAELKAVLQALIVNAVEAAPEGSSIRVLVTSDESRGARVDVEDDGPGLPDDVRRRLFTPHVTTKPTGSGMGLFLAQRITTRRYDGQLELVDRRAEGAAGTRAVLRLRDRVAERHDA